MRALAAVLVAVSSLAVAGLSRADVTIQQQASGKALGLDAEGPTTTWIKGLKMRSDASAKGETVTTILDVEARQMILLRSKKKQAEVHDLAEVGAEMARSISDAEIKVDVKKNGRTEEIAGRKTTGYDLVITVPALLGGDPSMAMTLRMDGTVFVAPDAPGTKDYVRFYQAAAERGLFFGPPQQAKAQPGQARGMVELYRAIAKTGGVAYSTDVEMTFSGDGMLAAMMSKMGRVSMSSRVTSVATDPIPDDTFAIPAGYKLKARK